MVSRMEGRVKQVETNLAGVREDVRKLEGWFQEMTEILARIEAQGRIMMAKASPSQTRSVGNQEEGSNVKWKFQKLQLLAFEGEDPLGWIFRVEQYFAVNEISEAERLQAAGRVVEPISSFSKINQYAVLMGLKQVSTVTVFHEEFEKVSTSMKEASDGMLSGVFLNELKDEIQAEMMLLHAQTLREIMKTAQKQVQGFKFESGRGNASNKPVGFRPNYHLVANILESRDSRARVASRKTDSLVHIATKSTSFNGTTTAKSEGQFKRLSDSEFARKREIGQLKLLIISEAPNTDEDETKEFFESTVEDVVEGEMKGTMMLLNMNSIVGLTGGRTMKLVGKIHGKDVIILVDSGATHNFISSALAHHLQLPIKKTKGFEVKIGKGQQKLLTMKFKDAGRLVSLRGNPAMVRIVVSLKAMTNLLKKGNQGFLVELSQVTITEDEAAIISNEIEKLLYDYLEVTEQSLGLPPRRSWDHAITL
ncbi:hypothetical protein H5410_056885 [Solanum commersonii]|uniref:Ty3-gypsy retrotransposon protein n=1 Tax=Solanum commersonii TaxID=4109 RepID=A0A9J5WNI9_SOLCO|nr:hypothetical protein H5410_056885 [Solanum commersonii]